MSDYCCTSANAKAIINSLPLDKEIIFVPDKCLGSYAASQTGRKLILFDGHCPTHMRILEEDILGLKEKYPAAEVMAHPECSPAVTALADQVLSTSGMCRYASESSSLEFIVATEIGLIHQLEEHNPSKKFYGMPNTAVCPNMKKITLEKVLWCLEEKEHEVSVPEDIRKRALRAVQRMVNITGN